MADSDGGMSSGLATFLMLLIILSIPVSIVLISTTCAAAIRTRRWKTEKQRRYALPQSDTAALSEHAADHSSNSDSDDTDSPASSENETDRQIRELDREEKQDDWHLTTKEKFQKEWKKYFVSLGIGRRVLEEKRKQKKALAKEVAKEMGRIQRRKERKAAKKGESSAEGQDERLDDFDLPAYKKVMDEGKS